MPTKRELETLRLMLTHDRAVAALTPEEHAIYEAGCTLRDNLGFGKEGNSREDDEAILDTVNLFHPGFDAVMEKWARLHEQFMNEGSKSPN